MVCPCSGSIGICAYIPMRYHGHMTTLHTTTTTSQVQPVSPGTTSIVDPDTAAPSARLRNSGIVFAGGACYGVVASVVKFAYDAGFSFSQVVCSQAFFAFLIFVVLAIIDRTRGVRRIRLTRVQCIKLVLMGMVTAGTTTFYYLALSMLPASITITLLFQFTWIGLIFEAVSTRTRPKMASIIAAIVIVFGTLLASGFLGGETAFLELDPLGIVCGLLAAICCATYMFLSGRIEVQLPVTQRGLWASMGYLIIGLALCPTYLVSGVLAEGIWSFGLILAPLGFVVPLILFGIGCKHLPAGLSTIMASSELPLSVLCSMVLLHEAVSALQVFGVVIILLGVVVAQLPALLARQSHSARLSRGS